MKKENVVIIGMGFLATYVMPCYERLLGDEISSRLVGIKGSERGLKERQAQCNFPIQVGKVRETLEEKKPGLIILAVKPNQIGDMTEGTLAPYYQMLREKGEALPDLYSFAPNPPVSYYTDVLGDDVNAANLLPNMISYVAGYNLSQAGVSFISFDPRREWPAENKKRAEEFLQPTGTVVEVDGDKANSFLAMQVACHLMFELNYIAQDVAKENGKEITLAQSASAYRALLRKRFNEPCVDVLPCSLDGIDDENMREYMEMALDAWYDGVFRFSKKIGIPEKAADRLICGTMETYHMEAQLKPKEILLENTKNHATPGGYLEMALITIQDGRYQYLEEQMRKWVRGEKDASVRKEIEQIAFDVAQAVSDRGETTSGIKR